MLFTLRAQKAPGESVCLSKDRWVPCPSPRTPYLLQPLLRGCRRLCPEAPHSKPCWVPAPCPLPKPWGNVCPTSRHAPLLASAQGHPRREGGESTPHRVCAGEGGELLLHPALTPPTHTLPVGLAKSSWLQGGERKGGLPSDRLHSQVTRAVITPFTQFLGVVGWERLGEAGRLCLQHTAIPCRVQPSLVLCGCRCCRQMPWGHLPQAAVLPSSVFVIFTGGCRSSA